MGAKPLLACLIASIGFLPLKHTTPPDAARIDNALNEFYHKYPQENVAILTDRDDYTPGETIWFSGYLTCLGKPSPVSKIIYVELLDSTGLILHRSTLPVEDGATEGDLALPDDFPAGHYQLRAYTNWMLNFNPAFFYHKELYIADTPSAASTAAPPALNTAAPLAYTLEFYPEGGALVEGLTSKIAVKTTPSAIRGTLLDSSNKPIRQFTTTHDGLGSFVLHPMSGNNYTARIEYPGGITKDYPLPKPQPSGVVLYVNHFLSINGDDSIYFRLSRSIKEKEKYQHLVLCAEMQGKVDFTYVNFDNDFAGNYNNTVLTAPSPLSLEIFPAGVLHLTVFGGDPEQPLAQRLVYLQRRNTRAPATLSRDTGTDGKNIFKLTIPGDSAGIYTVSVTRQSSKTDNLFTALDLTPDIPIDTKEAEWYCRNTQPETLQALDLLMLTNQWTRFDWAKLLRNEFPRIRYYAEQSLTLKGQAFWGSGNDKKPMHGGDFSLMIKAPHDSLFDVLTVPVDSEGRFSLVNLNFHDTAALYVQNSNKKKGREVSVLFERDPLDTIRTAMSAETNASDHKAGTTNAAPALATTSPFNDPNTRPPGNQAKKSTQHKQKDTTILSAALVRAHRKTHADSLIENYATGMFANPGSWAKLIDLTQDNIAGNTFGTNIVDYLAGRVAGLQVIPGGATGTPLIAWRISTGRFIAGLDQKKLYMMNAPAFFLDEQLLSESSDNYESAMEVLTQIPPAQVAMIRIFEPGTFAGVSGMAPHGVIAIYTKNGSEGKFRNLPPAFNKTRKNGYSITRTFQPNPNNRKTLYWNPALIPDSTTHTATFAFENDNTPGPLHITIQGLDHTGRILRIDTVFQSNPATSPTAINSTP